MIRRFLWSIVVAALAMASAGAQTYPSKPITLLCWAAAGSPVDLYARVMAKLLTAELGQNVIVENRTGGSGIVMVNSLVRSAPDGYTIAANTITLSTMFGEPNVTFKLDDLQMIARSQVDPYGIVAHVSTPFRTVEDFVTYARRKPGFINVGGPFVMSGHRVAWELLAGSRQVQDHLGAVPGRRPGAHRGRGRPRRCGRDQSRKREALHRFWQGARARGVFRASGSRIFRRCRPTRSAAGTSCATNGAAS